MFQKDYIMRLISEIIKTLLKLLFNIEEDKKEELKLQEDLEEKYKNLLDLIDRGEINDAENKLLEEINPDDMNHYKMALMFYSYLNEKDIDFLITNNYTKEEIIHGLKHISALFGYGDMASTLISTFLD